MSKQEIWDQIEADSSAFDALTTKGGGELSQMIRVVSEINQSVKPAEESLKILKKNRDRYL